MPEELDNCEFCLGAKGGVKGNENVYKATYHNGGVRKVVVCDYCSSMLDMIIRHDRQKQSLKELVQMAQEIEGHDQFLPSTHDGSDPNVE